MAKSCKTIRFWGYSIYLQKGSRLTSLKSAFLTLGQMFDAPELYLFLCIFQLVYSYSIQNFFLCQVLVRHIADQVLRVDLDVLQAVCVTVEDGLPWLAADVLVAMLP